MASPWQDPPGMQLAAPRVTPVVKLLLIANCALFLLQSVVLQGWFDRTYAFLIDWFALAPYRWRELYPWVPLWQLVTYGFLHGDALHLLGNMLFLYFLGTMLEAEVGSRRFAAFFGASVVLAGACQLFLGLALGHEGPILGASGGVLAIVCAMATLRPGTRIIFVFVPLTLKTMALIYVGLDVLRLIGELKGQASGVASFAHLTGALFGFLAVRRGWIWRDPVEEVEDWRGRRADEQRATDERRLDELLAKISREGIHSLSPAERAFLKRASQR